jgi:hypothetical protein
MTPSTLDNHIREGRVIYILALVALIQTLYPITADGSTITLIAFQMLYLLMIVAGILVMRHSPRIVIVLIALGLFWVIAAVYYALNQTQPLAQLGAYLAIAIYQAMVVWVLLRYVFTARRVNRDVIYAACAVYLLIGAVFVGIFGAIDVLTVQQTGQHAFRDTLLAPDDPLPWQHLIYYSYVTLTTAGYGDMLPVTWWARSAASIEAIIGALYLAVIVARLVGLYASDRPDRADGAP